MKNKTTKYQNVVDTCLRERNSPFKCKGEGSNQNTNIKISLCTVDSDKEGWPIKKAARSYFNDFEICLMVLNVFNEFEMDLSFLKLFSWF